METTFDSIFSRILAQSRLSAPWSKSAFLANFVANFSKKLLLLRSSLKSTLQSKSFYVKLLVTASYMYTFLTLFSIKSAIYSYYIQRNASKIEKKIREIDFTKKICEINFALNNCKLNFSKKNILLFINF